jgi:hypothetical protein
MPGYSLGSALDESPFAFCALRMMSSPIMPGHSLRTALGESRFAFCALRARSLFFHRWPVHGQRGGHNRVACCGYQILVGRKTLKHSFTVGDGVLAKLKCVIHARLLSVLSLRKRDRGPVQGDNNDEQDSLLHRGPSLRSTGMSTSPGVIRGPRDYGSPGTESIEAAHVAYGSSTSFRACARHFRFDRNFGLVAAWRRDASGTYLDGVGRRSSSGSLAKLTAIRRASSLVSSLAVDCRPGSFSKYTAAISLRKMSR